MIDMYVCIDILLPVLLWFLMSFSDPFLSFFHVLLNFFSDIFICFSLFFAYLRLFLDIWLLLGFYVTSSAFNRLYEVDGLLPLDPFFSLP